MSFPSTWRAISELAMDECLETELARGIARKAGIRVGRSVSSDISPDLMGQFNILEDDDLGYVGTYIALTEYAFPDGSQWMDSWEDARGLSQARLLLTVTDASEAIEGTGVFVEVVDGADVRGFEGSPPSAPLDTVGVHISEWRAFAWDASEAGERRAVLRWRVSNPGSSAAGSFAVGLCQLQVRG